MKKIAFVNTESFRDPDISLIELLQNDYEIDYYLLLNNNGAGNVVFLNQITKDYVNFKLITVNGHRYRRRDFRYFSCMNKLCRKIREKSYYRIITGIKEDIAASLNFYYFLKNEKIIYMMHDAERHPQNGSIITNKIGLLSDSIFLNIADIVMLFSKSQYLFFKEKIGKTATYINKPCVYYGNPTIMKSQKKEKCIFLFFGNISHYKGIETLIDAAEKLYSIYPNQFKIKVIGASNYEEWKNHLKTPSIYDMDIRLFEDREIPNIFAQSHFLVLPYKQVTQSGPLSLAFSYGIPVITTNEKGFIELVSNGIDGFIFETGNVVKLFEIMKRCIEMKEEEYITMQKKVEKKKEELYDAKSLRMKLISIIESLD